MINTAIHYACNEQITRYLIDAIPLDRRAELIWCCNNDGRTVFHTACYFSWVDTVRYICSLFDTKRLQELVVHPDKYGATALHCVRNEEIASLPADQKAELISTPNVDGVTLLQSACEHGWTDCVRYILSLLDKHVCRKLIFQQNILGATALHHAANEKIARMLLDHVPKDEQIKLLGTTDRKGRNILG